MTFTRRCEHIKINCSGKKQSDYLLKPSSFQLTTIFYRWVIIYCLGKGDTCLLNGFSSLLKPNSCQWEADAGQLFKISSQWMAYACLGEGYSSLWESFFGLWRYKKPRWTGDTGLGANKFKGFQLSFVIIIVFLSSSFIFPKNIATIFTNGTNSLG